MEKMAKFKRDCYTCVHSNEDAYDYPCVKCRHCDKWEVDPRITEWLNSFDTSSATKCFEAVNLLKQRLEDVDA